MAKADTKLYSRLRDSGVRKKVARRVSEALPAKGKSSPKAARQAADELSRVASEVKDRVGGKDAKAKKRSEAAKKAARTRKANERKRSQAAKKGAKARRRK